MRAANVGGAVIQPRRYLDRGGAINRVEHETRRCRRQLTNLLAGLYSFARAARAERQRHELCCVCICACVLAKEQHLPRTQQLSEGVNA